MSYLIAAQEAVEYHQRGIVTSSIQFFRTIGGAIGIGLAGALFNSLISEQLAHLRSLGVTPSELMDAKVQAKLPSEIIAQMRHMIAGGLSWVFAGMLVVLPIPVMDRDPMDASPRQRPQNLPRRGDGSDAGGPLD